MIILVGLPCSGKSFYSKYIGDKFNIKYSDTDIIFYNKYKLLPLDFIKKKGWKLFREYEYIILKNTIINNISNNSFILSTGGGIIEYYKSFNLLLSLIKIPNIKIIHLYISLNKFNDRFNKRVNKFIYSPENILSLYNKRIPKYRLIKNYEFCTNNNKNYTIFELLLIIQNLEFSHIDSLYK